MKVAVLVVGVIDGVKRSGSMTAEIREMDIRIGFPYMKSDFDPLRSSNSPVAYIRYWKHGRRPDFPHSRHSGQERLNCVYRIGDDSPSYLLRRFSRFPGSQNVSRYSREECCRPDL